MYGRSFGFLGALCLLVALFHAAAKAEVRIVQGTPIHIRQAPYTVQLRFYDKTYCGGTLVDSQFVVTAAHCFDTYRYGDIDVVAGANTRTDAGVKRLVVGFAKPPEYTRDTMNADVAVLKLDRPLPMGEWIQKVNLCSAPVPVNQLLQVSGWGRTSNEGARSHELRTIRLPIMDVRECRARSGAFGLTVTDFMSCTRPSPKDTCQGDSGGPAIYNEELCGVVSFGADCGSGAPAVYANVYALRSFINEAMKRLG